MPGLSDQKAWALAHFQGLENLLLPSFSPDFNHLDADGIRYDVQNCIRHGFFSMMLTPVGIQTDEEDRQFIKTVSEAAEGKISTGVMVAQHDLETDMKMIENTERFGGTHQTKFMKSTGNGSRQPHCRYGFLQWSLPTTGNLVPAVCQSMYSNVWQTSRMLSE
jgi:hypothetical protein